MSYGFSVQGVGGNASSSAFKGAAMHSAKLLGLPEDTIGKMLSSLDHLTSPMPFLPEGLGLSGAIGAGQHVSGHSGAAATPAGALAEIAGAMRR